MTQMARMILLLLLMLIVAACGDDLTEEEAEDALRAVFEGETDNANDILCETQQVESIIPDNVVFRTIDCESNSSDSMTCRLRVDDGEIEHEFRLVFEIDEDERLCNLEVE